MKAWEERERERRENSQRKQKNGRGGRVLKGLAARTVDWYALNRVGGEEGRRLDLV